MTYQCPACKGNQVLQIGDELVCLCGNREYLYDYNNAFDNPTSRPTEEKETRLEPRHVIVKYDSKDVNNNLMADLVRLKGEVNYLKGKLNQHLQRKRREDVY